MGTKRTEVEIEASLLPPNSMRFFWVSNDIFATRSKYRTDTDLDKLSQLAINWPDSGEEWALHLVGVDEQACSSSDEDRFAECPNMLRYLKLASSQLHPSSWAFMRAVQVWLSIGGETFSWTVLSDLQNH